jgi:hypothetical protein
MISGRLPIGSEQNLVGTFPGQYVHERNQVYWVYPCEEVAQHLTVVTSTTAQSDISEYARDAHAASVVPNE